MTGEFIEIAVRWPFGTPHHLARMRHDAAGPFALISFQPGQKAVKFRLDRSRIESGPGVPGARLRYRGVVDFREIVWAAVTRPGSPPPQGLS